MIEIKDNWQYKPFYDGHNHTQIVLNEDKLQYSQCKEWIIIGYPGVDGIDFRIKADSNKPTVYAHYPIDNINIEIAENISDLIYTWRENKISL